MKAHRQVVTMSNRIVAGLSPILTGLETVANDPLFKECPKVIKDSVVRHTGILKEMDRKCQVSITSNGETPNSLGNEEVEKAKKDAKAAKDLCNKVMVALRARHPGSN